MTDEVTNNDQVAQDSQNVNISLEQILASVLKTVGKINVSFADLITDYSSFTIAVNQNEDQSVDFEIVPLSSLDASQQVLAAKAE